MDSVGARAREHPIDGQAARRLVRILRGGDVQPEEADALRLEAPEERARRGVGLRFGVVGERLGERRRVAQGDAPEPEGASVELEGAVGRDHEVGGLHHGAQTAQLRVAFRNRPDGLGQAGDGDDGPQELVG